ncbi:MAG: adenylate/guanylate cyclase domain-containing protein [Candidatus Roizmanbacteria bacterium]
MNRKYIDAFFCGLSVFIVMIVMYFAQFFASWQDVASDKLFLPRKPHPDIVIIKIDDESIQSIGRWPWDREIHGRLLRMIKPYASVIGIDVTFSESSTEKSDELLVQAIKESNKVVVPVEVSFSHIQDNQIGIANMLFPISSIQNVSSLGIVNMIPDRDGITRVTPIKMDTKGIKSIQNFSIEILKKYYANKKDISHEKELKNIPTSNGYMRIRYIGKPQTYPMYSFADVLNGKINPSIFTGKIILIGSTASNLHDDQLTPVSEGVPMSGVEIHANVIQTILDKRYLIEESSFLSIITMGIVSVGFALLVVAMPVLYSIFALVFILFSYVVYVITSFDQGIIRTIIYPIFSLISVYVIIVIYKYYVENKNKRFIKRVLSYYVSDAVMQEILAKPEKLKLGGERREISVLFSDIAGFTSISEKTEPEVLATLLNNYLTRMTHVIFENKGVVDKFIGDAVMAFWNAPVDLKDYAFYACKTAIEMQKEIENISMDWKPYGGEGLCVRIGINTGEMVVGNMGSEMRFDYTLLGDNVNLGSRLESINKNYGTTIIISQSTYELVKNKVFARCLDTVAVKGKEKGIVIYELRGLGKPDEEEARYLELFEKARLTYHKGQFDDALKQFKQIVKQYPDDRTAHLYVERCEQYIIEKPINWDGVYHSKVK